jgi:hypothetical protein
MSSPRAKLFADLLLYIDSRDKTARFDEIAEKFYQETGFIRPGKTCRLQCTRPLRMKCVATRRG